MKYIDAEKLIKAIEEKGLECSFAMKMERLNTLALIDELQQEQPDFPTTDEQMKEFLATHPEIKMPEKYKNPDWLFKKQEQQEEPVSDNLEEEIKRYYSENFSYITSDNPTLSILTNIARHFAEWGEKNAYKAIMKKADEVRDKRFDTDYEVKIEPAAGFGLGRVNVYCEGKLVGQYMSNRKKKRISPKTWRKRQMTISERLQMRQDIPDGIGKRKTSRMPSKPEQNGKQDNFYKALLCPKIPSFSKKASKKAEGWKEKML